MIKYSLFIWASTYILGMWKEVLIFLFMWYSSKYNIMQRTQTKMHNGCIIEKNCNYSCLTQSAGLIADLKAHAQWGIRTVWLLFFIDCIFLFFNVRVYCAVSCLCTLLIFFTAFMVFKIIHNAYKNSVW